MSDSGLLIKKTVFILIGLVCLLTPWVTPSVALFLGIFVAFTVGLEYEKETIQNITNWLLKASVVGLGFGMDFYSAIEAGKEGMLFTILSITVTLGLGYILAKKLSVDSKTSILISSGTAICGGSAIAAMAPVINADGKQVSAALGAVFVLNSIALFFFPLAGNLFQLSEVQFGYWAAIAIHDTSSVVGAAATYGSQALAIATSVKLGRALWIFPLTIAASFINRSSQKKISIPYFIVLFVAAMLLNSFNTPVSIFSGVFVMAAKKGLILTLFLIGTGLSVSELREVGVRPMVKAVALWLAIAIGSLWMITSGLFGG